ncbi:ferritin-like domain-containing protein [Verrucomicrobiales bacterium]|jgi:uncharacterized ferritin-like protein (DUF455 family)|nr:ferritin-like domain-containing protein [Verrucomicrobiales bacterium]MDB2346764.1 ferritin-like domain-containing protein [Verrucomicrobiales bacterium]
MELHEFAERVLLATTLEEKLAPPNSRLVDESRGEAKISPSMPGRPDALIFERLGTRTALPSLARLGDDKDRGRLLHFFANHELLAAELMALVLLKFPDAPADFRMGVAKTLQEEQMHTRLYMKRLGECGVSFGSEPVNGFFWKAVSTMQTPADYVSRLCLTFEQANLDYSRHFAGLFQEAGDTRTAKILDRIYRDEISHVSHGLDWFRQWKSPGESDWESFRQRLTFPLSPSRAKGRGFFNREGRLEAGLAPDFVNQLEVFTQSKGRTPNVFHFNPQAESTVAKEVRGLLPKPLPRSLLALGDDLSSLSLFLARQDDIAILAKKPGLEFLKKLSDAGFLLPEIQVRDELALAGRKLHELRPWSWSPDTEWLQSLRSQLSQLGRGWDPGWHELHSKTFSAQFGLGQVCATAGEVSEASVGDSVWKAPYGVAGQGLRFVNTAGITPEDEAWRDRILKEEGAVVVEPRRERVLDFSVQYDQELRLLGYTQLHNDAKGRFQACSVHRAVTAGANESLMRYFYSEDRHVERFYEETFPKLIRPHLERLGYKGPLGVDAMIARDEAGELKHYPVIEINPRYTMGRVALELARQVVKGVPLRFEILSRRDFDHYEVSSLVELAAVIERGAAPRLETYQNGRRCLKSGNVILNDPSQAQRFLGVLRVGP